METQTTQRLSSTLPQYRLDTAVADFARCQSEGNTSDNDDGVTSPVTSPPYWVQSHQRSFSNISVESLAEDAITLQDNTGCEDSKNKACWAKRVYIEDYLIINGSRTNIGAFVTWNITVETLQVHASVVCSWTVADSSRVDQCEFEKDIPSSMTSKDAYSRPFLTPLLLCPLSHPKVSYRSSDQSSWKLAGPAYNTF
jgi:hypothetical protein